jgi:putative Mn2+ efflux pump MntP
MHEKHRERRMGGIFIPAFLFIGVGIGLLVGQPGVGALVGIGVGFIAMAAARTRQQMKAGLHSDVPEFISFLVGLMFVVAGIGLIYFPMMLWPYLGAGVLILLGLWFMFRGYRSFSQAKDSGQPEENEGQT